MFANFRRKKVQTQHDAKVRYIFTPTEQSYNNNLKNILFWTSSRKEERKWANKVGLVGSFEIEWKIIRHNMLAELLNN